MNCRNLITRSLVAAFALVVGSQALAARTTTFFHTDGLGSVVAATNEAGQVLWRKDYAPFGEQIDSTPQTERTAYTGKQHDEVTGLTYFGGRNFDPELGRFVSVDPVGFLEDNPMSFNRYLYVNNNPYKYVDPDGQVLNFAIKFLADVAITVAINYATSGSLGIGAALKESAMGVFNPAKTVIKAKKLAGIIAKAEKRTPEAGASAKRGPKTNPTAPHNSKIRSEADRLAAEGNIIRAGGGREKERLIRTSGGAKSGRRPDILYETTDGQLRGRNVGRTDKLGNPVPREASALKDLNGPGKLPTDFVGYN